MSIRSYVVDLSSMHRIALDYIENCLGWSGAAISRLSAGVSEINRRSFSTVFGGLVVGTAIIFACFHRVGTTPSVIDVLKIQHIESHNAKAKSRKIIWFLTVWNKNYTEYNGTMPIPRIKSLSCKLTEKVNNYSADGSIIIVSHS